MRKVEQNTILIYKNKKKFKAKNQESRHPTIYKENGLPQPFSNHLTNDTNAMHTKLNYRQSPCNNKNYIHFRSV